MSLFGGSRRGSPGPGEERIRGPGEDPRPGGSGSGVRISFALGRVPGRPGEFGLPGSGKDPRPGRTGGYLVFGSSGGDVSDALVHLRRREKRWVADIPVRLPDGAELHSVVRYPRSRYEIDVFAGPAQIDAVVDSVRSTIGWRGSGFSIEQF